jgi:hypothetical protein
LSGSGDNRGVGKLLFSALIALAALWLDAHAQPSDGTGLPVQVEGQADRIAQLMAGAHALELRTARRYHFVDVNGDGVPDLAVFFAIEGVGASKRYDSFIAVFATETLAPVGQRVRPSGYRMFDFIRVGSRGVRDVDFDKLSFAGGVFTLEASEPGEKGAAARKTRVLLRLGADGRLAEVKP